MDALDRLCRGSGDLPAGGRVAGQADHVDVGVGDEPMPDDVARTGHHVEDALGEDVGADLGQPQGRQRRHGGRLEDDGAAGGDGRAQLPDRHHERVVPRRHLADDPGGLAPDHRGVGAEVLPGRLALHDPRRAGEEADVVHGELDVEVGGALRLSDVVLLQLRQRLGVALDRIGEGVQHLRAILWRRLRPGVEGRARGGDGAVDVGGIALGDLGDLLLGGRVDDRCALAAGGIGPVAGDEHLLAWGGQGHGSFTPRG